MNDLHNISYQLGEIKGQLEAINRNTADIKKEVKGIDDRVAAMESERTFERGAQSQNRKIAGVLGSISGMAGGALVSWALNFFF